jgi:hypothetical protein
MNETTTQGNSIQSRNPGNINENFDPMPYAALYFEDQIGGTSYNPSAVAVFR